MNRRIDIWLGDFMDYRKYRKKILAQKSNQASFWHSTFLVQITVKSFQQ